MKDPIDNIAQNLYGTSRTEALANNCCVRCGSSAPPESFRDEISKKEYTLSGWCQSCQDAFYGEGEEWS